MVWSVFWKVSQVWEPERKMALPLPSVNHRGLFGNGYNGPVAPVFAVTVIVAEADLVESATLVAVTEKPPATPPALYKPEAETVPPLALHVTEVFEVPVTEAVNCCVPPACNDAEVGEIVTATTDCAVAVTCAEADFVESAVLVAVTVYVPAVFGAVYNPEAETVPALALHVTAVFEIPVTVAVNCCVAPV